MLWLTFLYPTDVYRLFSNFDIVCKKLILSPRICGHKGPESKITNLSNVRLVDVKFCKDHRDKTDNFLQTEKFYFDSHPHKMLPHFPKFTNNIHL